MDKKTSAGAKEPAKKVTESVYSAEELAAHADKVFGPEVRSECVIAAFKVTGKTSATKTGAQKLVETFMKKEVK